jgi:NAD(P)-dependent dehydrogenase (short-subunit alcohol dehydrogenase family)
MRTYFITGASSGIGLATANALLTSGHRVIGIDLSGSDVSADLSTRDGRSKAIHDGLSLSQGSVDAVIACAGLGLPIAKTVSVNYFGVTQFLNELLPVLTKSSTPRVVITSSMASLTPNSKELVDAMLADDEEGSTRIAQELVNAGGGAQHLIYSSTKRAISRWIRRECIKTQWAGAGIPLNAVGPAIVKTPMVAKFIATSETRKDLDAQVPMPLNYYMEPETVASLLIWLTSEANTHTTGQTIYIDGGSEVMLRGEDIWKN